MDVLCNTSLQNIITPYLDVSDIRTVRQVCRGTREIGLRDIRVADVKKLGEWLTFTHMGEVLYTFTPCIFLDRECTLENRRLVFRCGCRSFFSLKSDIILQGDRLQLHFQKEYPPHVKVALTRGICRYCVENKDAISQLCRSFEVYPFQYDLPTTEAMLEHCASAEPLLAHGCEVRILGFSRILLVIRDWGVSFRLEEFSGSWSFSILLHSRETSISDMVVYTLMLNNNSLTMASTRPLPPHLYRMLQSIIWAQRSLIVACVQEMLAAPIVVDVPMTSEEVVSMSENVLVL